MYLSLHIEHSAFHLIHAFQSFLKPFVALKTSKYLLLLKMLSCFSLSLAALSILCTLLFLEQSPICWTIPWYPSGFYCRSLYILITHINKGILIHFDDFIDQVYASHLIYACSLDTEPIFRHIYLSISSRIWHNLTSNMFPLPVNYITAHSAD